MRHLGKLRLLATLALPAALAGAVAAFCGRDDAGPDDRAVIKLPGHAARGVLDGDHFYAVADGKLTDVDLKQRKTMTVEPQQSPQHEFGPFVDVADGKACAASAGRLHIIDLKSGEQVHSAKYEGEVHGLGFAGDSRVFVLGRLDVVVVDVATGETVRTVPVLKDEPNRPARPGAFSAYQKVGKLLYIADSDGFRVKVVDLEQGKVVDEIRGGYDWCTALQVAGDKAFVRTINLSYGINSPQFGFFDVKAKKYTALKHPDATFSDRIDEKAFGDVTLAAGPGGGVCLGWKGKVYQYDGDGRHVGETPLANDDDGRLVGVWNGRALTAGKDALRLTALSKATTAKSD